MVCAEIGNGKKEEDVMDVVLVRIEGKCLINKEGNIANFLVDYSSDTA